MRARLLAALGAAALAALAVGPTAVAQDANDTESYVGEAPYVSEAPDEAGGEEAEVRGEQVQRAPTPTTQPAPVEVGGEQVERARGPLAVTGDALTWLLAGGAVLVGGGYLLRRRRA